MPRMLRDKYRNCCKFLAFFANWFDFSCTFLHFNFSYKNGFAFFCIIFAFFCILIFGGPCFSCICFAFFCTYIFFYVSQEEAQPDHTILNGVTCHRLLVHAQCTLSLTCTLAPVILSHEIHCVLLFSKCPVLVLHSTGASHRKSSTPQPQSLQLRLAKCYSQTHTVQQVLVPQHAHFFFSLPP